MLTLSVDMGGPVNVFSACLTTVTLCVTSCGKEFRTVSLIMGKNQKKKKKSKQLKR
jgi:hypothetical protein